MGLHGRAFALQDRNVRTVTSASCEATLRCNVGSNHARESTQKLRNANREPIELHNKKRSTACICGARMNGHDFGCADDVRILHLLDCRRKNLQELLLRACVFGESNGDGVQQSTLRGLVTQAPKDASSLLLRLSSLPPLQAHCNHIGRP